MAKSVESKAVELWKAFRSDSVFGDVVNEAMKERLRIAKIRLYYDTDDIFRRQIDGLKERMKKRKAKPKVIDAKMLELLREAEYRRYIASFDNMKENFEARKKEMAKVKSAFS